MSLSLSLNNALSGLTVNGKRLEVTSTNLANALTDGYGRKSVEASALVLDGNGTGVAVLGVNRAAVPELTAARRQSDGDAASATAAADGLGRLGQILGEATDDDSLFRRVEQFETALRTLAETPESAPRQTQAVEAARDLATDLNTASQEMAIVRQNADAAIAAEVATVNNNLQEIAELNAKIQRLTAGGRDISSLVDARELLIDEINASIPVRVHQRSDNVVHLTTAEGLFVLADNPATIGFTRSPVITTPMIYDPAGGGALSGLTLHGIDITPTSGHPQAITGGALAGHFAVRDQHATQALAQIDQFAGDLIARFEDPTVDPTLAAGDPGLFTDLGGALDPLTIDGLAGRIGVNALADPAQGGDPARLRDGLQSLGPGPLANDTTVRSYLDALTAPRSAAAIPGVDGDFSAAGMVSVITESLGVLRTGAETEAATLNATRETLATTEAQEIGVNTDEELSALIVIEQAFAANAQVIQATSRMFQEVVELR
jgi:flagellar hook-associated protein 1 FlgK